MRLLTPQGEPTTWAEIHALNARYWAARAAAEAVEEAKRAFMATMCANCGQGTHGRCSQMRDQVTAGRLKAERDVRTAAAG